MTAPAAAEIRELLAGAPGSVNRMIRRFGKHVVDYCTALIPDRSAPFDRMVEDVLVDIIAQSRAAARSTNDDEVFEFAMHVATQTIRARYRQVLEGGAQPTRATTSYSFDEVIKRTGMSRDELTQGISEGRIRAVRADDEMKIKADGIPGLAERLHFRAYHVNAAERELLCLHFRLGFSPAVMARWAGESVQQMESLIDQAARKLAQGVKSRSPSRRDEDTQMRRYIDGRLDDEETAKFEKQILKDKIAQARLDELRGQAEGIRAMFDGPEYDFSSVAINVRARNPHHALNLPPSLALWVQVVGIAAMLLMFHRVGAYVAPPEVTVRVLVGSMELPHEGRMRVGDTLQTPQGAQAMLVLDGSNRIVMAPGSKLELMRPRSAARQVLRMHEGEFFGRFASGGHAFAISGEGYEFGSSSGAEFDFAAGTAVEAVLPLNLAHERENALLAAFKADGDGLRCEQPFTKLAGYTAELEGGFKRGDVVVGINNEVATPGQLVGALAAGTGCSVTVRRGGEMLAGVLLPATGKPGGVLRVFQGAVVLDIDGRSFNVNRGQWALISDGPPLIGRESERFLDLRIGAGMRFRESLHWLNVEAFPLASDQSVLGVDRGLRAIADRLERLRGDEVRRDARAEIIEFERLLKESYEGARQRVERGEPRPRGEGAAALSDAELLGVEDEIMGVVGHWRRQSGTGIYATLGDAAKTLHSAIARGNDELATRDKQLGEAAALRVRLGEIVDAIKRQDEAIEKLRAHEFHDADGSKRKELSEEITRLNALVRAGQQAAGRLELVKVKLNELDAMIDAKRREVPGAERDVADVQQDLDKVNQALAENIYTPEKLKAAEDALAAARVGQADAATKLKAASDADAGAAATLAEAEDALKAAQKPLPGLREQQQKESDALLDAVTARNAAQTAVNSAKAEVDKAQAELDALPQGDPGREQAQRRLEDAQAVHKAAQVELEAARGQADRAQKQLQAAERALQEAEDNAASWMKRRDDNKTAAATAKSGHDEAKEAKAAADKALNDAQATLKAQEDAKLQRALLEQSRSGREGMLRMAQDYLKELQDAIARLEADAAPRRDEFERELKTVQAGEQAADDVAGLRRTRDRYQAVSDEIGMREKDRATLAADKDRLEGADAVRNYEKLIDEYAQLQSRVRAHEYLRARALVEDQAFAARQQLALDRFREAAENARTEAVELLARYCGDYDAEVWRKHELGKRKAEVMGALWGLYYDSALERSDVRGSVCYYVLVNSGAAQDAFDVLADSWRAWLNSALGKEAYESLDGLEPPAGK
ncbi:MAG: hypothetical protein KF696_03005 [Planctomycetes bacterium]|nr:hypothetical protein [Planctomycetota bacterium]MCW8134974.1 hypothetical protein [Planctomycetota bacterium]